MILDTLKRYWLVGLIIILLLTALFIRHFNTQAKPTHQPLFEETEDITELEDETYIYVDIKGEVNHPGVYKLKAGTRLFQLIIQAGGLSMNAEASRLNMAKILTDQTMVYIPKLGETTNDKPSDPFSSDKISISTASQATLETLPNIGPQTAMAIIEYRLIHGSFVKIEDIIKVSGIGTATFEAIKPFIVP